MSGDHELTREEGERILREGFGSELHAISFRYTLPLAGFTREFFSHEDGGVRHGSAFILHVDDRLFCVTADHVFQECSRIEQEGGFAQLGNLRLNLAERLIDRDPSIDVATFAVSQFELAHIKNDLVVHRAMSRDWPPAPPQEGKGIFVAGYPMEGRHKTGPGAIEWGARGLILTATSVRDTLVTSVIRPDEMIPTFGGAPYEPGAWLGGMSGSPIWTLVQTSIFSWRLAGVFVEYSADWGVLRARSAGAIAPDGSLRR